MQSGQLILTKISKIGASKCQSFRLKCTAFDFHWGSPDLLYLKSLIKGKEGRGMKEQGTGA